MSSYSKSIKNSVIALVIGNALEWYDFVIYSFMTVYIAKAFFPANNDINSLLATTATFGVAFCVRPLGGLLLGIYADKKGRKSAMTIIISLITVALLLIATAPTYLQIGIAAPFIILIARLLQGFSAGGEFGTACALLIELAPQEKRGFYCAWQMAGQMTAMILGSAIGMCLTNLLTAEQLQAWGWRIPFIFGLIIAPVGIYMRKNMKETLTCTSHPPLGKQIKQNYKKILIAFGLVAGCSAATYINLSFMPTYANRYLHLTMNEAFTGVTLGGLIIIFLIPIFGWLSDLFGRRIFLLSALFSYLICIYPLFHWLMISPTLIKLIVFQALTCSMLGVYFGVFTVILADLFPREIRSTSLAISYNAAVMLFGGFAQFIVAFLIHTLGNPIAITYYLLIAISISFIASLFYREPHTAEHNLELVPPDEKTTLDFST